MEEPLPQRKTPGVWRWLSRLLLLALVGLLIYFLALPMLAEHYLLRALRAAGINDAALHVMSVSPRSAELVDLQLDAEGRQRVAAVRAEFGLGEVMRGRVRRLVARGAVMELRIRDGKVDFGPLTRWRGSAAGGRFVAPVREVELRQSAVLVDWHGARVEIPAEGTIGFREDESIAVDLTVMAAGAPVRVRGTITPPEAAPEVPSAAGVAAAGPEWTFNLMSDPVRWNGGGVEVGAGEVVVRGAVKVGGERGAEWVGEVEVHGGMAAGAGVRVGGIEVRLPLQVGGAEEVLPVPPEVPPDAPPETDAKPQAAAEEGKGEVGMERDSGVVRAKPQAGHGPDGRGGTFRIGEIAWGERKLPAVEGRVGVRNGRVEVEGNWPVFAEAAVEMRGTVDAGLNGEVTVKLAEVDLAKAPELETWAPALAGIELGGKVHVAARVGVKGGRFEQGASVRLEEVLVRDPRTKLAMEGVNGEIVFDRLLPMSSPGDQRLLVKKLTLGSVELLDGLVILQVEGPGAVLIEQTRWRWEDGGTLRAFGIHVEGGKPLTTQLFVEDMGVQRWISLLTRDLVEGEGKLYGRVPVTYTPGRIENAIELGEGFLYANPGPGWFRLRDRQTVAALLDSGGVSGIAGEVRTRMEEGLANFEYSALTFDLVPTEGGLRVVMFTKGQSRNPERPVNFQGITINFNNFDKLVNEAMIERTALKETMEAWKKRLGQ